MGLLHHEGHKERSPGMTQEGADRPVIDCPDVVEKGEMFEVTVRLPESHQGRNDCDHRISWIGLFF